MASSPTDLAPKGPLPTPAGGVADWLAGLIATLGAIVLDHIVGIGDVTLFALRTIGWIFVRRQRRDVLLPAFYQIGVLSLPVVALTGLFIGMVLAVQSYAQFKALGLETRLGSVINLSLVRELGPVLAATNAFVHSFVLILVLDLFMGMWLNNVHDFFRPEGPRRLL